MILEKDRRVAEEFKEDAERLLPLVEVRVFGSRARGEADEDSDLDLFVELENVTKVLEEKVSDIAWEIGLRHGLVITPLVFSRYEMEESPLRSSPVVRVIMEEGVKV